MSKKWALITGASSGIGYDLSFVLDREGYNLVLVARNINKLKEVKKELKNDVRVLQLNLFRDDCDEIVYDFCESNNIQIDLLINNAGFGDYNSLVNAKEDVIKNMIKLNCISLASITKKFLPSMIEKKIGHIVQIGSAAGFIPGPYSATYFASKNFVIIFSDSLRVELEEYGIPVTVICPGPVRTNFQKVAGAKGKSYKNNSKISSSKEVAEYTFKMIKKKKGTCLFGFWYRFTPLFMRLPKSFVLWIMKKVQIRKKKRYDS